MTFMEVNRPRALEPAMTTDCIDHYDLTDHREAADHRELIAAAITTVGFVLLLPGAAFLMSLLNAPG
ncbi:hypothetical protein [uncultured Phenylobacterium sp.]|uniref:hypothetical protein n=1 Tax=uncultured Phenylobacterium sp. TaxID=349273 RepID=UPI0025EB2153|nr:hypothetical protein [uncultured Phenylobacterium sp.]